MTAALAARHPGVEVGAVELRLRDDGTNRRARFDVTYATGTGPRSVFVKAESDVAGRREIHARNGNLFNEPRLLASGVELPVDHPLAYAVVIDEAGLDYLIVMEDLLDRGADPRDATRPLTVDQAANGVRGLARLHSRYWNRVDDHDALTWVEPFLPTDGWQAPMRAGVPYGLERAGDAIPDEVRGAHGRRARRPVGAVRAQPGDWRRDAAPRRRPRREHVRPPRRRGRLPRLAGRAARALVA